MGSTTSLKGFPDFTLFWLIRILTQKKLWREAKPLEFHAELVCFCIIFWGQKIVNNQPLITDKLPGYGLELRKGYTKAVVDVSRGGEFWKLLGLGGGGTNDSLGGKVCQGRARVGGKWASSTTVSKDSTNTSCSLPTGCFSDSIYWITLQKMHISEYVWTCLKELATNTRKKNIAASNISENFAFVIYLSAIF